MTQLGKDVEIDIKNLKELFKNEKPTGAWEMCDDSHSCASFMSFGIAKAVFVPHI